MRALRFSLGLNSLYSIRIPFTWQSALTYPVLPPSAVIGLVANALQRHKNDKHPLEYLKLVEDNVLWAGSRLLTPCVIKSYTTSAIVKWEDTLGGKFTNALGREFAYTRRLECLVVLRDESIIKDLKDAIMSTPLTCGDSESIAYIDNEPEILNVSELRLNEVETLFPAPFTSTVRLTEGKGQIYLMHERCYKTGDSLPLRSFIVPIEEKGRIFYPTSIRLSGENLKIFVIQDGLNVVSSEEDHKELSVKETGVKSKRRKR